MLEKCPHCETEYAEGDLVDIGIGYQQISPNYPNCDCEYIEDMKEKESKFRGNTIYFDQDGECRYKDNDELTATTWRDRPCGYCNKPNRPDEHDACLGELPNVINACCGHGNTNEAYVQFDDKSIERYESALVYFEKLKKE